MPTPLQRADGFFRFQDWGGSHRFGGRMHDKQVSVGASKYQTTQPHECVGNVVQFRLVADGNLEHRTLVAQEQGSRI